MKTCLLFIFICTHHSLFAQTDTLHTAKNCLYMAAIEREMIYEINRLRSNPSSYLEYITPLLNDARERLKNEGPGFKNYSLTFTGRPGENQTVDTTWHYVNTEEVQALATLADTLRHLKPLGILKPDKGIYMAATKYAEDEQAHKWGLMHVGSNGSWPWDRITLYSPGMSFGNENIAAQSGTPAARDIVLQLLIDSGIPGYGHRYNMLDPQWTHIACRQEFYNGSAWWIEDFGKEKK